jgi:hypothetical protein
MDLNTILEKYGSFIQDHVLIVYSMKLISALALYLQKDSEHSYQLDKEKLLDTYKEQSTTERLFCPKYDDSEVSNIIEEFPTKIYYLSIEKLQDAFSTKWIAQEFPIIKQLVECSVLDQSLSMGEKVSALKGLRMLRNWGHPIADSEVWINSRQKGDTTDVLLWRSFTADVEDFERDIPMESVVKKEGDFFVLQSPYATIYFSLSEESDSQLDEYEEKLKQMQH